MLQYVKKLMKRVLIFRMNNKSWAWQAHPSVFALMVVVLVVIGYGINESFKRDDVGKPNQSEDFVIEPDGKGGYVEPISELVAVPEVIEEEISLNVAWYAPVKDEKATFLNGPVNTNPDNGPVGSSAIAYYRVGVVQGGDYDGADVYTVFRVCDGLCGTVTYRVLVKGEKVWYLHAYSGNGGQAEPAGVLDPGVLGGVDNPPVYPVLKNAHVSGLYFPLNFDVPEHKVRFSFVRWSTRPFDGSLYSQSIDVPNLGKLYYGESQERAASPEFGAVFGLSAVENGFYLKLADGTYISYRMEPLFMKGEETIPEITWVDGKQNSYDYIYSDIGGCGARNIAAVMTPEQVNPEKDLVQSGKTVDGQKVYELKDKQHALYKELYVNYSASFPYTPGNAGLKPLAYEAFVAAHPVFFWTDPFGRLIKFQRMSVLPAVECGKPVIYLYPEEEKEVSVKVHLMNGMTVSEPAHGADGWKVVARPDGVLKSLDGSEEYPYLYWEGRGGLYTRSEQGWMVARESVAGFLDGKLIEMGLNDRERADFLEFWLPRMQEKPWYFVTFMGTGVMDMVAPLEVSPRPDTVFRVLMDYEGMDVPRDVMSPRSLPRLVRRGFTLVEWGGVLGRE